MGKNLLQAALPIAAIAAPAAIGALGAGGALGAAAPAMGAFGSADMLAAGAAGGLLPGAAGAAAVPGSIESAGLLDMGGGNFVNPEYFVGESIGKPMFAGSPDLPFAERAGNVLGSMKDSMQFNPMKMMNMGQPQQQQVSRPPAIQRPNAQPATQVEAPYGQSAMGSRNDMTDEELKQRLMMARMGGLLNG